MRWLVSLFLCLFFFLPAATLAQPRPTGPINVTAQSLEIDRENNRATFSGSVRATQGGLEIFAQKLDIYHHAPQKTGDTLDVSGVRRVVAEGSVILIYNGNKATGNKADYGMAAGTIHLSGNVLLVRNENTLRGENLIYDTHSGRVSLSGTPEGGRVKAVFHTGPSKE